MILKLHTQPISKDMRTSKLLQVVHLYTLSTTLFNLVLSFPQLFSLKLWEILHIALQFPIPIHQPCIYLRAITA